MNWLLIQGGLAICKGHGDSIVGTTRRSGVIIVTYGTVQQTGQLVIKLKIRFGQLLSLAEKSKSGSRAEMLSNAPNYCGALRSLRGSAPRALSSAQHEPALLLSH